MVSFYCETRRRDGVTLVHLAVTGIETPTRVRIEHRLDGPLWPPRQSGVPEAGWTDDGFEAVLAPERQALGYATPAAPTDEPAALVAATPVPDADVRSERSDGPEGLVRTLGDPRPPADALAPTDPREREDSLDAGESAQSLSASPAPEAVAGWLETLAARTADAEALSEATTLREATRAVDQVGGLDGVSHLRATRTADVDALDAVAERAAALADRRAESDVPAAALETLA